MERTYKVLKSTLLEILTKNREEHLVAHEEAKKNYRKRAVKALEKQLAKATDGSRFSLSFRLSRPISYVEQYDKVIGLFKMVVEDTVEITSTEYSQYVLDEWSWRSQFDTSNSFYGVAGVAGPSGPLGPAGDDEWEDDDVVYDAED